MAVTIGEIQVEIQAKPAPANTPASGSGASADPRKDVDLHEALQMLHERKLRLRAD